MPDNCAIILNHSVITVNTWICFRCSLAGTTDTNNQGAETIVGRITLPKGLWIINCGGYSPFGLQEHNSASKIAIGQNWGALQNLSYTFNLVTVVSLNEETTMNVFVTNWESEPKQSTTNWLIDAYRI